jgi:hypothetical protein
MIPSQSLNEAATMSSLALWERVRACPEIIEGVRASLTQPFTARDPVNVIYSVPPVS